ncbi:MAG: alginate O-acetyltransferase AlgX-related protein [Bacteroidia bacterium]
MKKKSSILFWVLFACFALHWLFFPLGIIKDLPLSGYYRLPGKVELSAKSYLNGSFQDSVDLYVGRKMGLVPGFTRVHHQLEYSAFDKLHAYDVHAGLDNYLFRYCPGCITAGTFDKAMLDEYITRYLIFQDSLKAAGKNIVWIIAPDKNFIYSEKLSPELKHPDEISGFYWTLKKEFRRRGVNFIDFNELAWREKNKFEFPVFTKGGVHWSQAYAARCFDSLCQYLSERTPVKIKNEVQYRKADKAWDSDIDMESASNLLIPVSEGPFYLADVTSESNAKKKKLLLIGDSFTYAWTWPGYVAKCFDPASEFWYYNREENILKGNKVLGELDHSNTRKKIKSFDTFVFVFTALNAENLDYGFMDDVYRSPVIK